MSVTNLTKLYYSLSGVNEPTLNDLQPIIASSSGQSQIQSISPYDNGHTVEFTFTTANGKDVGWKTAILEGTETVVNPSTSVSETWNVWKYDVDSAVLSTVSMFSASPLYFVCRWKEQDNEYVGALTTASTVEATINSALKVAYPSAVEDEWALVTDGNEDVFSWEFDGSDWSSLAYAKPIFPIISNSTPPVQLDLSPSITATDGTLTNSQVIIIQAWLTALSVDVVALQGALKDTGDGTFDITADNEWSSDKRIALHLANYLDKLTYDSDGDGFVNGAETVDDGDGNSSTALEVATVIGRVNQDLKTTAEPTFNDATIDNKLISDALDLIDQDVTDGATPNFTTVDIDGNTIAWDGSSLTINGVVILTNNPVVFQETDEKNQPNGYAGLDADSKLDRAQVPTPARGFFGATSGDVPDGDLVVTNLAPLDIAEYSANATVTQLVSGQFIYSAGIGVESNLIHDAGTPNNYVQFEIFDFVEGAVLVNNDPAIEYTGNGIYSVISTSQSIRIAGLTTGAVDLKIKNIVSFQISGSGFELSDADEIKKQYQSRFNGYTTPDVEVEYNVYNGDFFFCESDGYTSVVSGSVEYDEKDKATYFESSWYKNDAIESAFVLTVNSQAPDVSGNVDIDQDIIEIQYFHVSQAGATNNEIYRTAGEDTLYAGRMEFVDLDLLATGSGLMTYSIDGNVTKKELQDGFGNQLDLGSFTSRGEHYILYYNGTYWRILHGGKDYELITGELWNGETLYSVHEENGVQNVRLNDIEIALATPSENILQVTDMTVPFTASATPLTKLVLDTNSFVSNNTSYLDIDGNLDQIVVDEESTGYNLTINADITNTGINPNAIFGVTFYLFEDSAVKTAGNELTTLVVTTPSGNGAVADRSKSYSLLASVLSLPETLVIYYTVTDGTGTIDSFSFQALSLFSSTGTPSPSATSSVTVVAPNNESLSGSAVYQDDINIENVDAIEELQDIVINSVGEKYYNSGIFKWSEDEDGNAVNLLQKTSNKPNKINGLTLEYGVVDPDFLFDNADGEWFAQGGVLATFADGIASAVTSTSISLTSQDIAIGAVGDKVYVKAKIYKNSGTQASVYVLPFETSSGALDEIWDPTEFDALDTGIWIEKSIIVTLTNSGFRLAFGRSSARTFDFDLDYFFGVRVPTHLIGASDAETLATMDALNIQPLEKGVYGLGEYAYSYNVLDNSNDFGKATQNEGSIVKSQDGTPYIELVADGATNETLSIPTTLSDNTKYTVLTHVIKNTLSNSFVNQRGTEYDTGNLLIPPSAIGVFKQILETGTIATNQLYSYVQSTATVGGIIQFRQIILLGDYTNISDEKALELIQTAEVSEIVSLTQLVNYGDFRASTGWTLQTEWTITGGVASYDDTGTGKISRSDVTITSGKNYAIIFDIVASVNSALFIGNESGGTLFTGWTGSQLYTTGHYALTYVASASDTGISVFGFSSGGTFTIDNLMIIEIPSGETADSVDVAYFEGTQETKTNPIVNDEIVYKAVGKNKFDGELDNDLVWGLTDANTKIALSGYQSNKNLVKILPSTNYYISADGVSATFGNARFYDINKVYISQSSSAGAFTTPSNAVYVGFFDLDAKFDGKEIQLEEGTSATTYEPYKETYSYIKPDSKYGLQGIGGVYDDELVQRFKVDYNDVVQSATGWVLDNDNGTTIRAYADIADDIGVPTQAVGLLSKLQIGDVIYPLSLGSSISTGDVIEFNMLGDLLRIRVLKSNLSTLDNAGMVAYLQANDVKFIYELDEYIPRSEINNNVVETIGELEITPSGTCEVFTPLGFVNRFAIQYGSVVEDTVSAISRLSGKQIEQENDIQSMLERLGVVEDDILFIDPAPSANGSGATYGFRREIVDNETIVIYFGLTSAGNPLYSAEAQIIDGGLSHFAVHVDGSSTIKKEIYFYATQTDTLTFDTEQAYEIKHTTASTPVIITDEIYIFAIVKKGGFKL